MFGIIFPATLYTYSSYPNFKLLLIINYLLKVLFTYKKVFYFNYEIKKYSNTNRKKLQDLKNS